MAVGANYSRGMGRANPATGKPEVVSRSVFDRDVKNPSNAKTKAETRINIHPRTTGGIAGAGAKRVNPVYRMLGGKGGAGAGGMFSTKNR